MTLVSQSNNVKTHSQNLRWDSVISKFNTLLLIILAFVSLIIIITYIVLSEGFMSSFCLTSKICGFSNPQQNFKGQYNYNSFPQANSKNYEFDGISDMVWRKNRFIETESEINSNHKQQSLNLSIDQEFMMEHTDVLINAFNDYVHNVQNCLKHRVDVNKARNSENGKFFDEFDAIDFISHNELLNQAQKCKFKQEMKYDKGLYNFDSIVASSMPPIFKDELSLISIVFFIHSQDINPLLVDDQKDIEQIVQKLLDQIVEELIHQSRLAKIFFSSKEMLAREFTTFIEKWLLTFLSVKFQFFSNKFYHMKKRIETQSKKYRIQNVLMNPNRNMFNDTEQEQSGPRKRTKLRF